MIRFSPVALMCFVLACGSNAPSLDAGGDGGGTAGTGGGATGGGSAGGGNAVGGGDGGGSTGGGSSGGGSAGGSGGGEADAGSTDDAGIDSGILDAGIDSGVADAGTDAGVVAVLVFPTSGLVTSGEGAKAFFTVKLASQPTANVVVPISSTNTAAGAVAPPSVTFTMANWGTPQTITVTGVTGTVATDINYTINVSATTSADARYSGIDPPNVLVTQRKTKWQLTCLEGAGIPTTNFCYNPFISADGRYVTFTTIRRIDTTNDANAGENDVYRFDSTTNQVKVASVGTTGSTAATQPSVGGALSDDGQQVLFQTSANTTVSGDTNGVVDAFVHTLSGTPTTTRVSVGSAGTQSTSAVNGTDLSGDGRYALLEGTFAGIPAGELCTGSGVSSNVAVRDTVANQTRCVSQASTGGFANGASMRSSLSRTGAYVAFYSVAGNLVSAPPATDGGSWFVYVRDMDAGLNTLASVTPAGTNSAGDPVVTSLTPARVSSDGRYVAFTSAASNLTDGGTQVFLRDLVAATTVLVSASPTGVQANDASKLLSISADGRLIVFQSKASNLVQGVSVNGVQQCFGYDVVDRTVRLISTKADGTAFTSDCTAARISADGHRIAVETPTPLVSAVGANFNYVYVGSSH